MDNIILCATQMNNQTILPNSFIENYMLAANGSYVKVYLYLTMCIQNGCTNLSVSSLADSMDNTEKDVLRALKYWAKIGLIALGYDDTGSISAITLVNPDALTYKEQMTKVLSDTRPPLKIAPEITAITADIPHGDTRTINQRNTTNTGNTSFAASTDTADTAFTANENDDTAAADGDFSWLLSIVEQYFGRMLTPKDVDTLSFIYNDLQFSSELIFHLCDHCAGAGKTSAAYIRSVAIAWHEKGVTNVEDAEDASASYQAAYQAVSKAFGIRRDLAAVEKKFIDTWTKTYGFATMIIVEACSRTMLAIGKPDFKYTDSILKSWHRDNVRTLSDIESLDKSFSAAKNQGGTVKAFRGGSPKERTKPSPNQFNSFPQRDMSSQEVSSLEQKLLRKRGALS